MTVIVSSTKNHNIKLNTNYNLAKMEKGQADTKKSQKKDWAEMDDEAEHDDEEIGAKNEKVKETEQPAKKAKAAGAKPQKN